MQTSRQVRNLTTKIFENSRSQIVFRTDIFRKLSLGAPGNLVNSVTLLKEKSSSVFFNFILFILLSEYSYCMSNHGYSCEFGDDYWFLIQRRNTYPCRTITDIGQDVDQYYIKVYPEYAMRDEKYRFGGLKGNYNPKNISKIPVSILLLLLGLKVYQLIFLRR